MKQNRTMKLWQMLASVCFSTLLLFTMFLPAYHINGKAAAKMYHKLVSNEMDDWVNYFVDIDELQEEMDEKVKDVEEEYGIRISSISPLRIMTHSYRPLFGEANEKEVFSDLKSACAKQRILLWVIYLSGAAVILLLIFSYLFQWVKYIPLAISGAYGLLAAVIFGIFQFRVPHSLAKAEGLGDMLGLGWLVTDSLDSLLVKIISSFWGIAFLAGLILSALLLILSVVCMFTGNGRQEPAVNHDGMHPSVIYTPSTEGDMHPQREAKPEETWKNPPLLSEEKPKFLTQQEPAPEVVMVPVGQIRCTKGAFAGREASVWENRQLVVGRSRRNADFILDHPNISNVHCIIGYRAAANSYVIIDRSTNGTFVNGKRLQRDVPVQLAAGTKLRLADGSNEITLK